MSKKLEFPGAEVPKEEPNDTDFATGLGARLFGREYPSTPDKTEPEPDTVPPIPDVVEPPPDVVKPIEAEESPNPIGANPHRIETGPQGIGTQGYGSADNDRNNEQKTENPALATNASDGSGNPPSDDSGNTPPSDDSGNTPSDNTTASASQGDNSSDTSNQNNRDKLNELRSRTPNNDAGNSPSDGSGASPSDDTGSLPSDNTNEGRRVGPEIVPKQDNKSSVHDGQPGQTIPDDDMAKRQALIDKYTDPNRQFESSASDNTEPNNTPDEGRRIGPEVVPRENDKSSVRDGQPGQTIPDDEMAKRQALIDNHTAPRPQTDSSALDAVPSESNVI